MSTVRHVPVDAGDVLFFLGSAVMHGGALPWCSENSRRAAILSYSKYSALYASAVNRQSAAGTVRRLGAGSDFLCTSML